MGKPASLPGWSVVAARDFDGDGKPDLLWQNDAARRVAVMYMTGANGDVMSGYTWIAADGIPGWSIIGARDFDGDGKTDIVWQNDATRQVTVSYMTGAQGNLLKKSWAYLSLAGIPGWTAIVR
jgi:hypothetical protein